MENGRALQFVYIFIESSKNKEKQREISFNLNSYTLE